MARIQKVSIGNYPTPIVYHKGLSEETGVELFLKEEFRSDALGTGVKLRQLEYLIGRALQEKYDTLILDGMPNSSCGMALSHYGPLFGLDVVFLIKGEVPKEPKGNYARTLGSRTTLEYLATTDKAEVQKKKLELLERYQAKGKRVLLVPTGATDAYTTWSGVDLAREICQSDKRFDAAVLPTGTGGIVFGLEIGKRLFKLPWEVIGACIDEDGSASYQPLFREILGQMEKQEPMGISAHDLHLYEKARGEGYGRFGPEDVADSERILREHGVYFGPTYMHKAFVALKQMVKEGEIAPASRALLLHTGGMSEAAYHAA